MASSTSKYLPLLHVRRCVGVCVASIWFIVYLWCELSRFVKQILCIQHTQYQRKRGSSQCKQSHQFRFYSKSNDWTCIRNFRASRRAHNTKSNRLTDSRLDRREGATHLTSMNSTRTHLYVDNVTYRPMSMLFILYCMADSSFDWQKTEWYLHKMERTTAHQLRRTIECAVVFGFLSDPIWWRYKWHFSLSHFHFCDTMQMPDAPTQFIYKTNEWTRWGWWRRCRSCHRWWCATAYS